jgi:hypothetical protein
MSYNAHNVACPQNGVSFKIKTRKSKKGTYDRAFSSKMAQNGPKLHVHAPFLDFLVLILNVLLILGPCTFYPGLVAPPENAKSFFRKTRMPQKGTCFNLHCARLHPSKRERLFFQKQEPTIFGLS